jgi:dTDP-4-amino-4,6-dideoxy-D-glucose acyltransferase
LNIAYIQDKDISLSMDVISMDIKGRSTKQGYFEIQDYSGTSSRTTIYSNMDDFSGEYLINPVLPVELTNITGAKVLINKYLQNGANSIIMPGIEVGVGTITGVFTLVNKNLEEWNIYYGIPTRIIKERKKDLLGLLKKKIE